MKGVKVLRTACCKFTAVLFKLAQTPKYTGEIIQNADTANPISQLGICQTYGGPLYLLFRCALPADYDEVVQGPQL